MAVSRLLPYATISRFKFQVEPTGAKNGTNVIFTTPEFFLEETLRLYFNGMRMMRGASCDFVVSESGGLGTGFDTVTVALDLAPESDDNLFVDYITAT